MDFLTNDHGLIRHLRQFTFFGCRRMGIDTQLHVKYRNADTARVELLQRKLLLLKQSGKLIQLQSCKQAHNAAAFMWFPIVDP